MNIINDILGWGLLLLGIFLIFIMISSSTKILVSMALSIPATIVFRSGVGFLRLSTAYRLAQKAEGGQ